MEKLPIFLTLAAAGAWTGAILFHSAVVAPATFKVLDGDNAGIFLRRLFPSFFRFGLVCGGLMLAGLVANAAISDSIRAQALALTVVMCILQAICLGMVPAINAARDQGEREAALRPVASRQRAADGRGAGSGARRDLSADQLKNESAGTTLRLRSGNTRYPHPGSVGRRVDLRHR